MCQVKLRLVGPLRVDLFAHHELPLILRVYVVRDLRFVRLVVGNVCLLQKRMVL